MAKSILGAPDRPARDFLAPAKVNLTLHVTGQRTEDGYHMLDSLVAFADFGDIVSLDLADDFSLSIQGPLSGGLPVDDNNLCLKAARIAGTPVGITLVKNLPHEAGLGGGSSDAAAVLRGISELTGTPAPTGLSTLGADVPVCMSPRAARMRGIGDIISPAPFLPPLPAVLINPGVGVATPSVFRALKQKTNMAMPDELTELDTPVTAARWLAEMRNDLEAPAIELAPVIAMVLAQLATTPGCLLSRMSGSGATCFGLFPDLDQAQNAASLIASAHPDWWVRPVTLS